MRELTLGGIHDDSDHLILLDSEGERYTVRIDEALRAAVRRDRPSVALLQHGHEHSALSPKEIQALLRGGASVESIAEMADLSEERIRRFEGPVRAERDHMARRAQAFRPGRGSDTTLASIVAARLAARNVDNEPQWDAWRRPDGSWTLQLHFVAGSRSRTATWHLDVPARVAKAEDDEARWLSDAQPAQEAQSDAPRPRLTSVRSRVFDVEEDSAASAETGTAVNEEELEKLNASRGTAQHTPATVDDASPWRSLEAAAAEPAAEPEPQPRVHHGTDGTIRPLDAVSRQDFTSTEEVDYVEPPEDLRDDNAHTPDSTPSTLPGLENDTPAPAKKQKKGRSSIPSWDDIVFGSRER